jgi:hypothetical protein
VADLRSILKRAQDRRLVAGSISKELIDALKSHQKQQLIVFAAIELFLVVGVAFCAYYLTRRPSNSGQVKLLAGLIGIGAGGGIEAIRRVWTQWSQTTLLLILLPESSDSQVSSIIDKLVKKL